MSKSILSVTRRRPWSVRVEVGFKNLWLTPYGSWNKEDERLPKPFEYRTWSPCVIEMIDTHLGLRCKIDLRCTFT